MSRRSPNGLKYTTILPQGFVGSGVVLREAQVVELHADGSARLRRAPTDPWEHHEPDTEMARMLWSLAHPLKPWRRKYDPGYHPELGTNVAPFRIASIDYKERVITLEHV